MPRKKKCFVIMPFSETKPPHTIEYWKRHYVSYLKPLIESVRGLEAFRSDPLRGNIASQIITDLISADIVVADLTDHNPNVLWELGVRQSYKHCTITIAETDTQIPFHFSHKGILFYNGDHLNNEDFEKQFKKSLKDCIKHPEVPDSPVIETLGGRGTLYSIVHNEENQRRLMALHLEIDENKEYLRRIHEHCKKNKSLRARGKEDEMEMISGSLRKSASELLYTNRYLDLPEKNYKELSVYLEHVDATNLHLGRWSPSPERCEKWFSGDEEKFLKAIKNLKKSLSLNQ